MVIFQHICWQKQQKPKPIACESVIYDFKWKYWKLELNKYNVVLATRLLPFVFTLFTLKLWWGILTFVALLTGRYTAVWRLMPLRHAQPHANPLAQIAPPINETQYIIGRSQIRSCTHYNDPFINISLRYQLSVAYSVEFE